MTNLSLQEKINIYKNLFKGRLDIFAVRWEKADKSASGYSPVCSNEWKPGICIKLNKGKCKDCQNKQYICLDEEHLKKHLGGLKAYGIYPMLPDNTSNFLAADFDGENWIKDSINFVNKCQTIGLPAYLEKSRSGNGGHVWLFFSDKYPAYKSRNIALNILREAKIIDQFDKDDSFDRIFPNQDYLGSEGVGNLIAFPLQGKSRKDNNSVFLDIENSLQPYPDQWYFLRQIKKFHLTN